MFHEKTGFQFYEFMHLQDCGNVLKMLTLKNNL
jgi:hypothetical protein